MDKVYIKSAVQDILNNVFKITEKRKIDEYHDRLAFACPYCMDSATNNRARRGTFYWKNCMVICYNCDKKIPFDRMCRDFNYQLDPDKKLEIIEHIATNVTFSDYEDTLIETQMDKLLSLEELTRLFNTYETPITDFKPVQKDSATYYYLVTKRGIPANLISNIYEANYWRNADSKEGVICLLNRRGDRVLGMQIRNMKDGKARFFKIYNYESLYKWLYGEEKLAEFDINELIIYNKLSYYFGILNIDVMQRVTVFEGYLDSIFFENSIGVTGVGTDLKFIESNLDVQYFFDNDEAGHKKTEEKLKDGYPVFLWKKLFKNVVDKKNSPDPHELLYRISKIKDLNQLSILVPNSYKKLELVSFFSKDILDIEWIPKLKKKKSDFGKYNKKFRM
jgi:hypothetical protein